MPRRKPFSNKQKKQQLQDKRIRKKGKEPLGTDAVDLVLDGDLPTDPVEDGQEHDLSKLNSQPLSASSASSASVGAGQGGVTTGYNPNRFCLQFEKESNTEIERRKRLAKTVPITSVPEQELEVDVDEVYAPGTALDIPHRPQWSYSMSKKELETLEEKEFEAYLKEIHSKYTVSQLSYFENNLETWRQLWRVLEMSDVVLLITDVRHPILHFSPALHDYVVKDLKKRLVLVLNKVDLVPPQVVVAWRHYFLSKFPGLGIICFTSYPGNLATMHPGRVKLRLHRRQGKLPSAVGPRELLKLVEKMYSGNVDLSVWNQKLEEATPPSGLHSPTEDDDELSSDDDLDSDQFPSITPENSSPLEQRDRSKEGVLTIGMIGHPNVGKSSIINGIMGKKMVSTSRTPGHTKHFQTLYLTPTLRLCDCPGLVFPSLVNKQLQILSGIFPVAQVREPYSVVGYLAQRTPLVQQLQLVHPEDEAPVFKKTSGKKVGDWELPEAGGGGVGVAEREWTPWDICDAWAIKRGYFTSRAARPDTYKAANSILRLAVEGRISMFFRPPGFSEQRVEWEGHPEVAEMIQLQRAGMPGEENCEQPEAVGETDSDTNMEEARSTTNKFATLVNMED